MQRLFVYGSLAPGQANEHLLAGIDGTWEQATIRGKLYDRGWGASSGFPGLVLSEEGKNAEGHLFSSTKLSEHWAELDEFEGQDYRRVLAKVSLNDNRKVDAYVYTVTVK